MEPDLDVCVQVMYAEPIAARNGASTGKTTPPSGAPSRSLSVRSDSNSSILQHRSLPAGKTLPHLVFYFLAPFAQDVTKP